MSPEPRRGSPGNNRFGARGTLKCLNCRNRKARCEFSTKDDDCRWCAQRGLVCGDKLLGEKHQIREHRKRLGIGNTPLSVIAGKLELAYPRHTPWEICEMAREILLENGDGPDDLLTLSRQNSQSHDDHSTPLINRPDSIKPEGSPKTPPLSIQSQTFLAASQTQRSPPRCLAPLEQQASTIISIDHLPPYQDYNFTINYSATTPIRQQYEERDQAFDPSIFSHVNQRMVDAGAWNVPGFSWQEA